MVCTSTILYLLILILQVGDYACWRGLRLGMANMDFDACCRDCKPNIWIETSTYELSPSAILEANHESLAFSVSSRAKGVGCVASPFVQKHEEVRGDDLFCQGFAVFSHWLEASLYLFLFRRTCF